MPRPAEFDRDAVLASAIRVFARHGYEAASTSDLTETMGIGRQSLYGAFGDKRRLFLEALERYSARSLAEITAALEGPGPVLAVLESAVLVGLGIADDLETGCLGVGSIVEFGRSDPEINSLNDLAGRAVLAAFAARVSSAIDEGELQADLNPDSVSRMLLSLRSGLKVAARNGSDVEELQTTVRLALSGLVANA